MPPLLLIRAAHTHTHNTHTHKHTHTRIHTHTHSCTQIHTHTNTHTHSLGIYISTRLPNPQIPGHVWAALEPVATSKILPNNAFGVRQPPGKRLPTGRGTPHGGCSPASRARPHSPDTSNIDHSHHRLPTPMHKPRLAASRTATAEKKLYAGPAPPPPLFCPLAARRTGRDPRQRPAATSA